MMQDKYLATDRFEELDHVDLDEVFAILNIYCQNLLPDMEACLVFLSRILRDKNAANHPQTREWVTHLIRKVRDLGPFHPQGLNLVHKLTGDEAIDARIERLNYFVIEPNLLDLRSVMNDPDVMQRKRTRLMDVFDRMPGHILAASQLLQLDYYSGIDHGEWLDSLTVPKFFQNEWKQRLFLHYAGLGATERAMELWPAISQMPLSEIQLNLMAELCIKTGQVEQGVNCYEQSLKLDPNQHPIRYRLAELKTPTRPDVALVDTKSVTICLYSWNKADDLKKTLHSLSQTNIGKAKLRILLNGCSDGSNTIANEARAKFPNTDFDIIELPVNIGAPAARNWLGSLPEVRESEFVAYLDDDVELPSDWLAHFLTVMETRTKTSVVGCKVVFGSEPRMIQYLHRRFSLQTQGILKLTDPCQIAQFDYGQYNYICETDTVMGCCHLLRMSHMPKGPNFDLRYSPSQVDDIAHDIQLRIDGGEIRYCGLVTCIHHQNTGGGFKRKMTSAQLGQVLGNDMKFYYYFNQFRERIQEIMRKS